MSLNHEIVLLQEVDPSGPMLLAAQLNGSSYTIGGHATGLGQFQSTSGIGCSMNYWPPEFERSGCLHRAFMEKPVCDPNVMKTHFANAQGEMHTDRRGDKLSAAGWQLSVHAVWSVESGKDPGIDVIPARRASPDPPPYGRFIERGHHKWIQCMNFHFRPDEATKPTQAKLILLSVLRLCFKTKTMVWSGDFNKSRDQMKEIVEELTANLQAHPNSVQHYGVENVKLHYDPAAPEIMLILIKYRGLPGWTWEPSPQFDWVRAEEIGLHIEETDAHRPLVGHLISTEPAARYSEESKTVRPRHQRSDQSSKQRKEKKQEKHPQ